MRPATVFGPEDRFLNWIAEAMERLPVSPLINGGSTLVQPVYCGDVGKALMTLTYVSGYCVHLHIHVNKHMHIFI